LKLTVFQWWFLNRIRHSYGASLGSSALNNLALDFIKWRLTIIFLLFTMISLIRQDIQIFVNESINQMNEEVRIGINNYSLIAELQLNPELLHKCY